MLNWFSLADLSLVYLFIPINLRRNKIEIPKIRNYHSIHD